MLDGTQTKQREIAFETRLKTIFLLGWSTKYMFAFHNLL